MKSAIYPNAKAVPPAAWFWPNFKPSEIASRDGPVMWDTEAMNKLQKLRISLGAPLAILSAYRTPAHNAKVGGARYSKHMQAEAFDIKLEGHDRAEVEAAARAVGFSGFGHYPTFLHVDIGPPRQWWHNGREYITQLQFEKLLITKPFAPDIAMPAPDQDAAKEKALDELGALFGGAKIANRLKRKRAAA